MLIQYPASETGFWPQVAPPPPAVSVDAGIAPDHPRFRLPSQEPFGHTFFTPVVAAPTAFGWGVWPESRARRLVRQDTGTDAVFSLAPVAPARAGWDQWPDARLQARRRQDIQADTGYSLPLAPGVARGAWEQWPEGRRRQPVRQDTAQETVFLPAAVAAARSGWEAWPENKRRTIRPRDTAAESPFIPSVPPPVVRFGGDGWIEFRRTLRRVRQDAFGDTLPVPIVPAVSFGWEPSPEGNIRRRVRRQPTPDMVFAPAAAGPTVPFGWEPARVQRRRMVRHELPPEAVFAPAAPARFGWEAAPEVRRIAHRPPMLDYSVGPDFAPALGVSPLPWHLFYRVR